SNQPTKLSPFQPNLIMNMCFIGSFDFLSLSRSDFPQLIRVFGIGHGVLQALGMAFGITLTIDACTQKFQDVQECVKTLKSPHDIQKLLNLDMIRKQLCSAIQKSSNLQI